MKICTFHQQSQGIHNYISVLVSDNIVKYNDRWYRNLIPVLLQSMLVSSVCHWVIHLANSGSILKVVRVFSMLILSVLPNYYVPFVLGLFRYSCKGTKMNEM
jgi:hypothetical protein